MTLLVGVDAGASHTAVAVADHSRRVLARGEGPPSPLRPGTASEVARQIARLAERVILDAGSAAPASALVVGAAGAARESERAALEAALSASGIATRVQVTTDAAIALQSAFGQKAGIVVLAGTGAIAVGRAAARGATHRVGGWGWQFGDEGSGYALARAALAAVTRAADGRGPDTRLTQDCLKARGVTTVEDLLAWARGASPDQIAALAPMVCDATARAGDPVAETLVETAARELSYHVDVLLARLGPHQTPVALAGGLLHERSPVRAKLVTLLSQRTPPVTIAEATVDPAAGALALASRLTG